MVSGRGGRGAGSVNFTAWEEEQLAFFLADRAEQWEADPSADALEQLPSAARTGGRRSQWSSTSTSWIGCPARGSSFACATTSSSAPSTCAPGRRFSGTTTRCARTQRTSTGGVSRTAPKRAVLFWHAHVGLGQCGTYTYYTYTYRARRSDCGLSLACDAFSRDGTPLVRVKLSATASANPGAKVGRPRRGSRGRFIAVQR